MQKLQNGPKKKASTLTISPGRVRQSHKVHHIILHLQHCGALPRHHRDTRGAPGTVVRHAAREYHHGVAGGEQPGQA